jgi:hypothetical protein
MEGHRTEDLDEGIRELTQAELNAVSGAGFLEWFASNFVSTNTPTSGKPTSFDTTGVRG